MEPEEARVNETLLLRPPPPERSDDAPKAETKGPGKQALIGYTLFLLFAAVGNSFFFKQQVDAFVNYAYFLNQVTTGEQHAFLSIIFKCFHFSFSSNFHCFSSCIRAGFLWLRRLPEALHEYDHSRDASFPQTKGKRAFFDEFVSARVHGCLLSSSSWEHWTRSPVSS